MSFDNAVQIAINEQLANKTFELRQREEQLMEVDPVQEEKLEKLEGSVLEMKDILNDVLAVHQKEQSNRYTVSPGSSGHRTKVSSNSQRGNRGSLLLVVSQYFNVCPLPKGGRHKWHQCRMRQGAGATGQLN